MSAGKAIYPTTSGPLFDELRNPDVETSSEAWGILFQRYEPPIRAVAEILAARAGLEADDIVQQVFLVLPKALVNFDYDPVKGRFRGYLGQIISNVWRQLRNAQIQSLQRSVDPQQLEAVINEKADELSRKIEQQHLEAMAELIRQKVIAAEADSRSCENRLQAWLRYWRDGHSHLEIAREMGVANETVSKWISRVNKVARKLTCDPDFDPFKND